MISRKIEKVTNSILRENGMTRHAPIPIGELCCRIGIRLSNAQFKNPQVSGMIVGENGWYNIYVASNRSKSHRRMTVAMSWGTTFCI